MMFAMVQKWNVRLPQLNLATAGFALAAVVLLTVAVVVPEVDAATTRESRTAALADANAIGIALRQAEADTGCLHAEPAGPGRAWLLGPGMLPRGGAFGGAHGFPLSGMLTCDRVKAGEKWRGPYLDRIPVDPWGRAYVVSLDAARFRAPIMIVSSGPDGILDTKSGDTMIAGDDVGIILSP